MLLALTRGAKSVRWRGRDETCVAFFAGGEGAGDEGDDVGGVASLRHAAKRVVRADIDADGVTGAVGAVVVQGDGSFVAVTVIMKPQR